MVRTQTAGWLPGPVANTTPRSLYPHHRSLTIYFEALMELVWKCTWRRDRVNWGMHVEAVIDRVWRWTGRPWSSEFVDALEGRDEVNSVMHLEAMIKQIWTCTWRPWSSEFGNALGGRDWVISKMHSEAVTQRVWRCSCMLWSSKIGGVLGGGRFCWRRDGSWDSIDWLTCNCGNVASWVQHPPRDEKLTGSGRLSIVGWFCTCCMLYSVLTHDYGMER